MILKKREAPKIRKYKERRATRKRRKLRGVIIIGENKEKIANIIKFKRKSIKDIVTELNTAISLGNFIFKIIEDFAIKDPNPIIIPSLKKLINIIPSKRFII
jgi:hypothetical protein